MHQQEQHSSTSSSPWNLLRSSTLITATGDRYFLTLFIRSAENTQTAFFSIKVKTNKTIILFCSIINDPPNLKQMKTQQLPDDVTTDQTSVPMFVKKIWNRLLSTRAHKLFVSGNSRAKSLSLKGRNKNTTSVGSTHPKWEQGFTAIWSFLFFPIEIQQQVLSETNAATFKLTEHLS